MDAQSIFAKTDAGHHEIATRAARLGPRLRALLILVDGQSTPVALAEKASTLGVIAPMLAELEAKGFIVDTNAQARSLTNAQAGTQRAGEKATSATGAETSIGEARRYAIDQMLALLGPGADMFTARLETTTSRQALVEEGERCMQAVRGAAGLQKAERFMAGLKEKLG
jgi:hypothetical protein